ncbi:MAG: hypothetical protein R3325_06845 [Thermoanaerobaculia bacterium]|nr:hypothetical protein [Thermoanaerobaculia bacterium]
MPGESGVEVSYRRSLPLPPDEALAAVAAAAEQWGAAWEPWGEGGRLALPVTAGVRRGVLSGRIEARPLEAGCELVFHQRDARYRLNRSAVLILLFGALGAVAATLWPFFPQLLAVAPLAVVLALSAWFLVSARVRTSTPEDFFDLVEWKAAGESGGVP